MSDAFVPQLQLNTSRGSAHSDGASVPRLNHTSAPWTDPLLYREGRGHDEYRDEDRWRTIFGALNSNNSTSLTNNTSNTDWLRDSRAGGRNTSTAAEPLSPIPRVSESAMSWGGARQFYAGSQPTNGKADYAAFPGSTNRYSRVDLAPSATRPLFTTFSISQPRDKNFIEGDTGRICHTTPLYYSSYRPKTNSSTDAAGAAFLGLSSSASVPLFAASAGLSSPYLSAPGGASTSRSGGYNGGGFVRVPYAEWRREVGRGGGFTAGVGDASGESVAGLVNSRSRARADRWTDEKLQGGTTNRVTSPERERGATRTASSSPPLEDDSGHRSSRQRHHSQKSRHLRGHRDVEGTGSSDHSDTDSDRMSGVIGDDSLSIANAIAHDLDAKPIVPLDLLRSAQESPFAWSEHPSHGVVLSLLQRRGIHLLFYRELVEYHMAELFLNYLDLCRDGAYFVYYAPHKWPKERFLRIRMLPVDRRDAKTRRMPYLVLTFHEGGVRILESIPLDELVNVTTTPLTACFRPFLESHTTLVGCRGSHGHRARMPVDGAFSLWFRHSSHKMPRSVDILTCDAKVFDIWTKAFRGLLSVNSSSIVHASLGPRGH